jgi:catechol 2,3-dioxygenase-like lactoylglutathione lyase family enzyme
MPKFSFDYIALSVADLDAQSRFYSDALGLVEETQTEIPDAHIRTVILRSPSGIALELIERHDSAPREVTNAFDAAATQGYTHWALAVDDLDSCLRRVLAAGATAVTPAADARRPGVRFAYVQDPEGNLIELTTKGLIETRKPDEPTSGVHAHRTASALSTIPANAL